MSGWHVISAGLHLIGTADYVETCQWGQRNRFGLYSQNVQLPTQGPGGPILTRGHGSKAPTPPPVNIPIPTKIDQTWVVHLPQNGTIGFDNHTCVCVKLANFGPAPEDAVISVAALTSRAWGEISVTDATAVMQHVHITGASTWVNANGTIFG